MDLLDFEQNLDLESFRERSNTWPLRPNRVELEPQSQNGSPTTAEPSSADTVQVKQERGADPLGLTAKKSGARRNAWGNLSYADLITKAIQSSPEKRLTLSQIYDWMVQNVPYFKDKGDTTSSAGWKNSIRHNLSLHSRFMRIQNEGTGKSSWWVINPDAKPGKAPRRRAVTMETKSMEKKRGRLKKKMDSLRAAMDNGGSPMGGSVDFLDTLALGEFRSRTNSNASSCSRLSPVPPDLHDNQVPPMSPIPWDGEMEVTNGIYPGEDTFPDLVNSLAGVMSLSGQDSVDQTNSSEAYLPTATNGLAQDFTTATQGLDNLNEALSESSPYSQLPAPPPYPNNTSPVPSSQKPSPMVSQDQPRFTNDNYSSLRQTLSNGFAKPGKMQYTEIINALNQMNNPTALSVNTQQVISSPNGSQQTSPCPQSFSSHLSPQAVRARPQESKGALHRQLSPQHHQQLVMLVSSTQQVSPPAQSQQQSALHRQLNNSILWSALTQAPRVYSPPSSQFSQGVSPSVVTTANSTNINTGLFTSLSLPVQRQIQQLQQQQAQQVQQQQAQQQQVQQQQAQQQIQQQQVQAQQQIQQQQIQQVQPQIQVQQQLAPSTSNGFLGQLSDTSSAGIVSSSVPYGSNGLTNGNNNLPVDIDMDSCSLMTLDYDMDQVIKQELSLEGNLDATFDNITPV